MHGAAVDIEPVESSRHHKHAHVAHRTEIGKLTNLVLKESLVD